MHSLSLTGWHAYSCNVHISVAFNCMVRVSVSDGVISACVR